MVRKLYYNFQEPMLYTVKGIAILDSDGNRILAKYYDKNVFPTSKEQKTFEKNLFNKTHRANAEIIMLDGLTCVYKSNVDLFFYVMGNSNENEVCSTIFIVKNPEYYLNPKLIVLANLNECSKLFI